jgi:hypothetical protein
MKHQVAIKKLAAQKADYHREMLVNEIATEWQERVQLAEGKRMSGNVLDALIKQKQEEHKLTRFEIKKSLVSLMQQMAKLRQPLNISEGLSLANSLVEGMKWEDAVVNFKVNRGWIPVDEQGNKKPILGKKWYNNFWKRHSHLLERKKGHKFSKDCSEWSIHRNFIQMYDEVYEAMETAGVAEKLSEPMWVNEKQQLTDEENAFGRKATHLLMRCSLMK